MKVFVIDTSMERGATGIAIDGSVAAERIFDIRRGSTSTVHSYIREVFDEARIKPGDVNLIGFIEGPGSFTGLRVALSAAKGLAHPFNTPITGIHSTLAIANMIKNPGTIVPIIDARRGQFYRAVYRRDNNKLDTIEIPSTLDRAKVVSGIPDDAIITGPGISKLDKNLRKKFTLAGKQLLFPDTGCISELTLQNYNSGILLDIENSTPCYLREPDAKKPK
ncbi:MAG: tRNA (adenosine(37)-N6)-threonylcarbamoyltransferase complex dimerization subunit type 1 TsaB [candidate division Zixibacteria bacterium]|nr:tRNA (adenosine(37)-N6)-threonylcarbamoyltransferase complex dimerization subunit type 1 TsaB [candidate division Zixibacteria bacterium]